jgi:hypothetical protein
MRWLVLGEAVRQQRLAVSKLPPRWMPKMLGRVIARRSPSTRALARGVWAPEALSGRTDANVTPRAAWTASRGRRRSKCKPSALAASPIASTAMPKCWNSFIPAAAAPPSIAVHAPVHSDRPSGRGELGPTSSASFSWFLCCFYAMRFDKGLSRTSLPRLMYRCRSGPEA